ncbi:MAG: hypothetical protein EOM80_07465 [Erysipelotrichia bacterium]|nr:hypothetical protein [Erysipelotrichia bacterium]
MQNNRSDIFLNAEELRKAGRHQQAAELFRQCWNQEKNEDHAWHLISCLRHLQTREEAWQILYEALELVPGSHFLNIQHSWMLYDFELTDAKSKKNHEKTIEIARKILDLSPDGVLLQLTVFAATDAAKALNMPEKILEFLVCVDKATLDKAPREYNGSKILSWRERWYFACINSLFDLERFAECRAICIEAYKDFPVKIEYARKAALCLAEANNYSQAADELEKLVRGRRVPWYMYADLAKILFECGQVDKAWHNACAAAEASGELKTKVNLFYIMARILLARGERTGAAAHAYLAVQTRSEQGWSVPEELSELISRLNVQTNSASIGTLLGNCRKYWSEQTQATAAILIQNSDNVRYKGLLLMKNPQSPFAFIRSESFNENVYVKTADIPEELRHDGAKICFSTQTSFDAKKNRESTRAVNISAD